MPQWSSKAGGGAWVKQFHHKFATGVIGGVGGHLRLGEGSKTRVEQLCALGHVISYLSRGRGGTLGGGSILLLSGLFHSKTYWEWLLVT
jgi:hypothetical protein